MKIIYNISHYAQKTCAEMRINMESLVGRSQNVAAIIERKKKNIGWNNHTCSSFTRCDIQLLY